MLRRLGNQKSQHFGCQMFRRLGYGLIVTGMMLAFGCVPRDSAREGAVPTAEQKTNFELRTYVAPEGQEREVGRLLREINYPITTAGDGGARAQFVLLRPQFTGGGHFVVAAPASIHEGIKELLADMAKTKGRASTPSLEVSYWVVLGRPAAKAEIAPELNEAGTAIQELGKLGPMKFDLLEKIRLITLDGEEGYVQGRYATVTQTGFLGQDEIELHLDLRVKGQYDDTKLTTRLGLKPDQFGVLGQVGYGPVAWMQKEDQGNVNLFYLAQAHAIN